MMEVFVWNLGGDVRHLPWVQGAWGEQDTEDELRKLGPGWHLEHDIPRERGNCDHVAVRRAGMFAIETKWTSRRALG